MNKKPDRRGSGVRFFFAGNIKGNALTKSEMFRAFLENLSIDNAELISRRYGQITASLNKTFRDTDSQTSNSLQVGSYGRWTAIKGISDLDMLYILPESRWGEYKDDGQSKLLADTKIAIKERYPATEIFVDRLVVRVLYSDFHVEVQPVFEQDDGSFKYPDTYNGGSWKITKPSDEIRAIREFDAHKNRNLRRLCKMVRAWKNKHGVAIGGLLIDTLAHNFFKSNNDYDNKSFLYYDRMGRDFFLFLSEEPDQEYYAALGSGQRVKVKARFQSKAKAAYELCVEAIEAGEDDAALDKWKKIYGRPFPGKASAQKRADKSWDDTEELIEDKFRVDIRNHLRIDCHVSQNGFRESRLSSLIRRKVRLMPRKKLEFHVAEIDVNGSYDIYWKVLNRGVEAERRNDIRGQIVRDRGFHAKEETTTFMGEHVVECYVVKDGVVVAKDRIDVPIQ